VALGADNGTKPMTFSQSQIPLLEKEGWPIKEAAKGTLVPQAVYRRPAGVVIPEEFSQTDHTVSAPV
jgi:hypothetical protein